MPPVKPDIVAIALPERIPVKHSAMPAFTGVANPKRVVPARIEAVIIVSVICFNPFMKNVATALAVL